MAAPVDVTLRCLTCGHMVEAHDLSEPHTTTPCQVMACSCPQVQLDATPPPLGAVVPMPDDELRQALRRQGEDATPAPRHVGGYSGSRPASEMGPPSQTPPAPRRYAPERVDPPGGSLTPVGPGRGRKFRSRPLLDVLSELLHAIEVKSEDDVVERYHELREVTGISKWARPTSAEKWKLALRHELAQKLAN